MSTVNETIRQRLQDEICSQCCQNNGKTHCHDEQGEHACPLTRNLDGLIEIVSGMRDYSIEPFREKVRSVVCEACTDAKGKGYQGCELRESSSCVLDDHFPKIIAIIEKELAQDPGLPD